MSTFGKPQIRNGSLQCLCSVLFGWVWACFSSVSCSEADRPGAGLGLSGPAVTFSLFTTPDVYDTLDVHDCTMSCEYFTSSLVFYASTWLCILFIPLSQVHQDKPLLPLNNALHWSAVYSMARNTRTDFTRVRVDSEFVNEGQANRVSTLKRSHAHCIKPCMQTMTPQMAL